jgi:DNA ligase-1
MAKQHFLQQAQTYCPAKHSIIGLWGSEKLDGIRCFWDGGISRGLPTTEVPWANVAKDKKPFVATGLWSRYGKAIFAPDWFLDQLPKFPLDGELWSGRKNFQQTKSIVSTHIPTARWHQVAFVIFDQPCIYHIMRDRVIDIPNYYKELTGVADWLQASGAKQQGPRRYADTYQFLKDHLVRTNNLNLLKQQVFHDTKQAVEFAKQLTLEQAEGAVFRRADALYVTERTYSLLKLKPELDSEATVVGYVTGRETAKGSKLLGMMGAMIVEWRGKRFKLSGFTDTERQLVSDFSHVNAFIWASTYPEQECPSHIYAPAFPRGSTVTFSYRELSDDGVPKEARFLRTYDPI